MLMAIEIDAELLKHAQNCVGHLDPELVIKQALTTLIAIEAGRRLAEMGGSDPLVGDIPRRRWD